MSNADDSPIRPFTSRIGEGPATTSTPAAYAVLAPPTPSSTFIFSPEKIKTPTPAPYDGDTSQLGKVRQFVCALEIYFDAVRFGQGREWDEERVRRAATMLSELAAVWYAKEYRQKRPLNVVEPWKHFVDALIARFEPVSGAQSARIELRTHTQGDRRVVAYNDTFSRLLALIDNMAEEDKVEHYINGLRSNLASEVDKAQQYSLENNMAVAVRIEAALDRQSLRALQSTPRRASRITSISNVEPETFLGAIQPPDKKLSKLSSSERTRLLASGGCFRCRQDGHWGKDCPTFPDRK